MFRTETGRRVVARYRLADGSATDVIGDLQHADETGLEVLPDLAPAVWIAASQSIAVKPVPGRTVRPNSALPHLSRLMAKGWPGLERCRLGGWLLAASAGHTRRANCCLPLGDPGPALPTAVDAVERFFAERGLPSRFQVSAVGDHGGDGDRAGDDDLTRLLADRGYTTEAPTSVLVAGLADLPARERDGRLAFGWSDQPDAEWLALQPGGDLRPWSDEAVAVLTASSDHRFVTAHDSTGEPVAGARLAVIDRWVGLSCLQVRDDRRREGIGAQTVSVALDHARQAGARFAYLQVERSNPAAHRLYESAGFTRHHGYRYWTRTTAT